MNDFLLRIMTWAKSQDRGASVVEYALIVALIALGLVAILGLFRAQIGNVFASACASLNGGTACR